MTTTDGRAALLARAVVLAATTAATSALAHVVGGGHLPDPVLLGAMGVLLLAAAVPVARHGLRPIPVLLWSGAAQLAAHAVLGWLHPVAGTAVSVPAHHGVETAATLVSGAHAAGPAMLVAHLAGTAVAVGLAVAADRAAVLAWSWWRGTVALLLGPAAPIRVPRSTEVLTLVVHLVEDPLAYTVARRGPPVALAA